MSVEVVSTWALGHVAVSAIMKYTELADHGVFLMEGGG